MSTDDYRQRLRGILSRLDRMATEAQSILDEPGDTELLPRAEELREFVIEMIAAVEQKLDRLTP